MTSEQLQTIFGTATFEPVDVALYGQAQEHLDQLTKPVGSLGELERIAQRLFAIGRGRLPIRIEPGILFTVAADHGIARQGVSAYPQEVTRQMVFNCLEGGAAINILCRVNGLQHKIVDAGCAGDEFPPHNLLLSHRLGHGSNDLSAGPAMTRNTCIEALRYGHQLGAQAAQNGFACIATGELGISNSTAATALYCAFLGKEPAAITGPGAGALPPMVRHKAEMIAKALAANAESVKSGDPIAILAALGGFEIAVLAGLMLACASQKLPLVVDGFICTSAYVSACAIFPPLADYAFLSHISAEPAFVRMLPQLNLKQKPLLDLGLRLGEGTGAALAYPLLRSAAAIYNEMATFASAGVAQSI